MKKLNVFDYTPPTFQLDFFDEKCESQIDSFLSFFDFHLPNKQAKT